MLESECGIATVRRRWSVDFGGDGSARGKMEGRAPILVTGSHCSGTTWVGRMLSHSPAVVYIHEPFHINNHDVCAAPFEYWFTYVCSDNEARYVAPIDDMLRVARRRRRFAWYRRARIPLVKDPIALFSAPWLASRFGTRNVVLIRHPAAFAGSLKVKRWTHPFSHFLRQPLLMQHHLQPFAEEIRRFARGDRDIVDQASLLWNIIHSVIRTYQVRFPDWIYLRHEDLSRQPLDGFRCLFERLDLELRESTRRAIIAHAFAEKPTALKRDSLRNIDTWKQRLAPAEIDRLKGQVGEIAREFYSDREW
jgi:hypothetical protein